MKVVANLALQTVSIAYELHETEIPDAYRLETVVKCETNVPAPSIEVKTIGDINGEEMEAGESKVVTVEVTNNGLIEANGFRLNFPASNKKFSVTPLAYPNSETLAPNETTKFVFKFTKKRENEGQDDDNGTDQDTDQDGDQEDAPGNPDEPFWWENLERTEFNDCLATFAWHYWYRCGKDIKDNHGALALAVKACTAINITNAIIETNRMIAEAFRNYYHWPNGSTGGGDGDDLILVDPPILDLEPRIYGEYPYEFFIDNPGICDPCIAEIANIAVEHAVGRYGIAGEIVNAFSDIYEEYAEAEASNDGGEPVPAPNYNEYMAEVAELLAMHMADQMTDDELADFLLDLEENRETIENLTVSYTHLTLPTKA